MRKIMLAVSLGTIMALSACAGMNAVSTVTTNITSATAVQVTSLGDAITAVDTITKAINVYLALPTTTKAQAQEVLNLSVPVHTELVKLQEDHVAGNTLVFDSLNAAIATIHSLKL